MLMLTLRLCAWSRTVIELLLLLTLLLNKFQQTSCSENSMLLRTRVIRPSNMFLTNPLLSCISDVHNVRVLRILSKLMHCVRVCRHRPGIMRFLPEGLVAGIILFVQQSCGILGQQILSILTKDERTSWHSEGMSFGSGVVLCLTIVTLYQQASKLYPCQENIIAQVFLYWKKNECTDFLKFTLSLHFLI